MITDELKYKSLDKPFKRFYFSYWHDWDSFIFWKPMNWRDFHFIGLVIEINSYHLIDVDVSFLGFNFCFCIYKKGTPQ